MNLFSAKRPVRPIGVIFQAARLSLVLSLALLAGCASLSGGGEDAVVERAKARWDAVIRGDLEAAYAYYTPGFRSTTSVVDYAVGLRTRRVGWTSAEYKEHACEENRCTVRFMIGYRVKAPVPGLATYNGQQAVEDTWIRTDGQWWYLPPDG